MTERPRRGDIAFDDVLFGWLLYIDDDWVVVVRSQNSGLLYVSSWKSDELLVGGMVYDEDGRSKNVAPG